MIYNQFATYFASQMFKILINKSPICSTDGVHFQLGMDTRTSGLL